MSLGTISGNKRIAKNTMFLYFRMLMLMLISLYTSRVVLEALGVVDYGVYNVVGGFVAMFAMFSSSMTTAFGRYITIEIGKGNAERLRTVFSTAKAIQLVLSLVVIVVAETLGLWVVNEVLVIPPERMMAANWCYQLSLLSFIVGLFVVPYHATIIAHEQMSVFAYVSLFEGAGKLAIALCIAKYGGDRLILFAVLAAALTWVVRWINRWYCRKHYQEALAEIKFRKDIFNEIFQFAGWNYLGIMSSMIRIHGISLLMNVFFGPAVNAARGLAAKAESAMYQFVTNFSTAFSPQIIKLYAKGENPELFQLICRASKMCFLLFLLISLPVLFETKAILGIWLKDVPAYTELFLKLTIVYSLIRSLSLPLITAINASGKIKWYQISLNMVSLAIVFPVTYLLYKIGYEPFWGYVICVFVEVNLLVIRLYYARSLIGFRISLFFKNVLTASLSVTILSVTTLSLFKPCFDEFFFYPALSVSLTIALVGLNIFVIGLDSEEKKTLIHFIINLVR